MATELDLNRDQGHINKRSYEKIHFSGSIQSHSLNWGSDLEGMVLIALFIFNPLLIFQSLEFCGLCGRRNSPLPHQAVGPPSYLTKFVYNIPILDSPMLLWAAF